MPRQRSLSAAFYVIVLIGACKRESVGERTDSAGQAGTRDAAETTTSTPARPSGDSAITTARSSDSNDSALSALACSPTTFAPGDTVTVRMDTPHGHYLWITKSDRTAYLVIYPPQAELKSAYSLMSSDKFAGVPTIRLPSDIQAIPYVYARDTIREPVFTEAGKYLLEVGDNFATDLGTSPPSCNLTFVRRNSK